MFYVYLPEVAISLDDGTLTIASTISNAGTFAWQDTTVQSVSYVSLWTYTSFTLANITGTLDMHVFTCLLTVSTVTPYTAGWTHIRVGTVIVSALPVASTTLAVFKINVNVCVMNEEYGNTMNVIARNTRLKS